MKKNIMSQRKKQFGYRAQAMVEFAIALPVLLAVLIGIMEVGRMILMYALVVNASRDAVRYASAIGRDDTSPNYFKYKYCDGIKSAAQRSAYFVTVSTTIAYDSGPNTASLGNCTVSGGEQNISVDTGNRVTVTVTANYSPMVKFLPIKTRPFTAASTRTILGIFDLPNP